MCDVEREARNSTTVGSGCLLKKGLNYYGKIRRVNGFMG